ncbi:TonB-dependent receptor domain-containing protein [Pseudoalteromonas tunicata]|jgi:outer membrane receptor protein involved in Fe transport|uniref:TonB-dependent receptor n=1 Tax=Pseudoalteromonas tunicata D2 TaxID=87626 RepID=A4C5R7_9GAMM|nr:TonB-dependent receptor [Pseudoalteromonas tunicata]ATC95296.1 hypothetical protein PTUN_a2890 [Pseudoalteromonas tunicata]AXT30896.1 TonB-dependent receptor [Pseudoalteromonas tunicata]EAR29321.1 hypothetical protein PTD2_10914 [Pseudoalteromonas tunicata D2]
MLNNKLTKAVRLAIAYGAASTAVFATNTFAAEEGAEAVERIEVTGSRIKRTDMESASPVQITSQEEIALSGFTRIEDMMNSLPQIEASETAFQANGASGTATLDLRGLGSNRTLVLINGRRMQAGGVNSQAPDINQIPASLVKRVEVLTGGGSSTYGADAVAGVVNFVMNDDFEGFEISVGGSAYQHNNDNKYIQGLMDKKGFEYPKGNSGLDGSSLDLDITLGGDFDGGKGHAVGYITYKKQNELRQAARDYSSCALDGPGTSCGGSGNAVVPNFYIGGLDANGGFNWDDYEYWTLDSGSDAFKPSVGNSYNYAPINHFMRPDERFTFGTFLNYEINDHFRPYMEMMFMRDRTTAQIAESGTFFNDQYDIPVNTPLLSDTQRQQLMDRFGLGIDDTFSTYIGKRNTEGGPRASSIEHNAFRLVVGTEGEINDNWTYDFSMQYGSTSSSEAYLNDFFGPRIKTALSANDESCAATAGCIPYEVFTYQGISQESAKALTGVAVKNGVTEQIVIGGYVTGELDLTVPSADAPIAVVLGSEYREENYERITDEVYAQGLLLGQGGATKSLTGGYDLTEFYGEASIPLVSGAPMVEQLTMELGYRYSDYSTTGGVDTYKVAFDWTPMDDYKVRASYNRAVRAPNVAELFSEQSKGLWGGNDPCAGASPQLKQEECARTGVSAAQYGNVSKSPANQYNGLFGGNPDLQPEVADTMSFGIVAQPIDNLNFSIDYWDIELEEVIGSVGPELTVTQCALTGNSAFCDNITRSGNGSLWIGTGIVKATSVNLASRHWEGVDVSANYNAEIMGGNFNAKLIGTYMLSKEYEPLPGTPTANYDCVDNISTDCFATPEWRHTATFSYDTGSFWTAQLKWRYFGSVGYDGTTDKLLEADGGISSQSYFDLKGSFEVNDHVGVLVGVNNIFDKEPPLVGGTLSTNANAVSGFYDSLGRYVHASVTFRF